MTLPSRRQFVAAVCSGLLLVLAFPAPRASLVAWIALVPLLLTTAKVSRGMAFTIGWITGFVFFAGTLRWLTYTMVHYGHIPTWLSYPLLGLLAAYLALYVGLFALQFRLMDGQPPWLTLMAAPATWVALEFARTYLLTGFPWAIIGYSQAESLPVIQIAEYVGVYGISFVIVLVNVAFTIALAASRPTAEMPLPIPVASFVPDTAPTLPRRSLAAVAVAVCVLTVIVGYGHWRLDRLERDHTAKPVRIAVVQGNVDQDHKWDPAFLRETINRYQDLTREQTSGNPDLIIWPEAAMPFYFERDPLRREELLEFVEGERTPLLFGAPAIDESTGASTKLYNSAYLIDRFGSVAGRYDKMHLVPFGEYVPFSTLLAFVDKLVTGIGEFVPGSDATVFPLDPNLVGVMICFEVVFPDLTRRVVRNGATVMATITNDAWFGRSAAPYQHMDMVVFRAVEHRVPFARAANTGISGFIHATGRVEGATDLFVPASRTASLAPRTGSTWYTRYGDVFAWACVLTALAALVRTRGRVDER